jgi:hypothetical protein
MVKLIVLIRALLPVLAIAGLILSPLTLATAVDGMHMQGDPAHKQTIDHVAAAMDDMPCCPEKTKAPGCATVCPSMALCAGQAFYSAPVETDFLLPLMFSSRIAAIDDAAPTSLSQGPPPRPPKSWI